MRASSKSHPKWQKQIAEGQRRRASHRCVDVGSAAHDMGRLHQLEPKKFKASEFKPPHVIDFPIRPSASRMILRLILGIVGLVDDD